MLSQVQDVLKKESALKRFLTKYIFKAKETSIPFFAVTAITLDSFNLFSFDVTSILFFITGSVIGTFYILFLYGKFAKIIQQKTGKLTKDINLILAILTGLVAIFTSIKIFF